MSSPVLAFTGFALQLFSICVWIGGLIYFAVIASRVAFRILGNRSLAGDFTAACLRRFQGLEVTAALLLLCGAGFLYVAQISSFALWVDVALTVAMFVLFAIYGGIFLPKADSLRLALRDAEIYGRESEPALVQSFHELHVWYARLAAANIVLGIALLLVLTFLAMQCGQMLSGSEFDTVMFGGTPTPWP
ncbi:MAG: hypothetical protein ACP5UB_02180 [Candidatus Sumerlaeaceae bacterium]|jgi:uncharacterized membrane protein